MKIGIIEIMPVGHYTLVNSLVQIYSSDEQNEIFIFTHKSGSSILKSFTDKFTNKVNVICKDDGESIDSFIKKINEFYFDKLYIVSVEKYFKNILKLNNGSPIFLVIHNIEEWFDLSVKILAYNFFSKFLNYGKIIYTAKNCFIYPFFKRKIKTLVQKSEGKYVVLNNILKKELSKYIDKRKIEVIPFSVYDSNLHSPHQDDKILHVCIPGGFRDNSRRDYISVFKCIEKEADFYRDKIELCLLGRVISPESNVIIKEAKKLIEKGIKIKYWPTTYIPMEDFEKELAKTDIILANINVFLSKFKIYGKTKDTGAPFAMIKSAKPGIFPQDYAIIDELKSSVLTYNTYDELSSIFKRLINEPDLLKFLSEEAAKNAKNFEPQKILNSL
jgi:hypothetical protein